MNNDELVKNLKIVLIVALVIGIVAAVLYLIYDLALIWQAMAAGILTGFLVLMLILFIALSIYLWIKNFLTKRELKGVETELKNCKAQLKKFREEQNEN